MPLRHMDIHGSLLQIAVAEENLDGAQVGAGLQQMGRKAVTKGMRMKRFANAGAFSSFATGVPAYPGTDRIVGGMPLAAWKQPCNRFAGQPAIMLSQFVEQMGAEHHVAVLAARAVMNMEDHALAIDIGEFQACQLGPPYSGGIERHQNGAVKRVRCGFD